MSAPRRLEWPIRLVTVGFGDTTRFTLTFLFFRKAQQITVGTCFVSNTVSTLASARAVLRVDTSLAQVLAVAQVVAVATAHLEELATLWSGVR